MQWRVVAVGAVVGVVLFVVAALQVLEAVWPRPGALARPDAEIDARWAELRAQMHDDASPEAARPPLVDVMLEVGAVADDEPVPVETTSRLVALLDEGADVPHYGCTGLPLEVDASRHIAPFDWLVAARGLVDAGRADLAQRVGGQLRDGQDLLPYAIGLGIYSETVAAAPDAPATAPTARGLYDTVLHTAHCADEVMARFSWDEAEDWFGQGRVPPRWWYDPAADRRALRDYHLRLLAAIEPHRDDPVAMSQAIERFGEASHPARHALISRILTTGDLSMLRGFLEQITALSG